MCCLSYGTQLVKCTCERVLIPHLVKCWKPLLRTHCRIAHLPLLLRLHWSTCNANLQRRFATHVFRTNLQTCYTFESLSKTSKALPHCKYRKKIVRYGGYTGMIFRATSCRCKLALQVDQCNTIFSRRTSLGIVWGGERCIGLNKGAVYIVQLVVIVKTKQLLHCPTRFWPGANWMNVYAKCISQFVP